jgi:hypothetical protein
VRPKDSRGVRRGGVGKVLLTRAVARNGKKVQRVGKPDPHREVTRRLPTLQYISQFLIGIVVVFVATTVVEGLAGAIGGS